MSHAQSHEHKHGHELKDGVHKLGEGVDALKDNLSGLAHDAATTARAGTRELRRGINRTIDAGRKGAAQAVDDVSDRIAENPLTSIAIALGVGFAIGALMGRVRK